MNAGTHFIAKAAMAADFLIYFWEQITAERLVITDCIPAANCGTCSAAETQIFRRYSRYIEAALFSANRIFKNGPVQLADSSANFDYQFNSAFFGRF